MKSDNDLISASLAAFICTHNACRSQMAEALGRKYGAALFDSCSAGTKPASSIDPTARRLMKELYHMDMEKEQFPKSIRQIPHPDILISMGCPSSEGGRPPAFGNTARPVFFSELVD